MASEPSGKAGKPGMANLPGPTGPPPSTLAAQLVQNISTSTRSSRPDETSEMKRLLSAIEKAKINPNLVRTKQERIEHNHLLIYMCGNMVLDGLNWDDLFADQNRLRAEALKVLNFLTVTIKETPDVLGLLTDGSCFILRGKEPLWLWILPKVLKLLGHRSCLAITAAIQDLFRFILELVANNGILWNLAPPLMRYLQANLTGVFLKWLTFVSCMGCRTALS